MKRRKKSTISGTRIIKKTKKSAAYGLKKATKGSILTGLRRVMYSDLQEMTETDIPE